MKLVNVERDATVSTPSIDANHCKEDLGDCTAGSANGSADNYDDDDDDDNTHSLGSWKDEADRFTEPLNSPARQTRPMLKKSWADMAMEDEVMAGEDNYESNGLADANDSFPEVTSVAEAKPKVALSRDQRECIRFYRVERKKDFLCLERINGKLVNILEGLELHKAIFSAAEQKRIVSYVEQLDEMGKKGQLKGMIL